MNTNRLLVFGLYLLLAVAWITAWCFGWVVGRGSVTRSFTTSAGEVCVCVEQ